MARTALDYVLVEQMATDMEKSAIGMMEKYEYMLNKINDTNRYMIGDAVETQTKVFRNMKPTFEQMKVDILAKVSYLKETVAAFKEKEEIGAQNASEQGRFGK